MAKSLSEELLGLLDTDTQAKVKAAFAANPRLIAQDLKAKELVDIWEGFGGEMDGATTTTAATTTSTAHTPTVPITAASTTTPTTTTTTSSNTGADGMAAILAKLDGLRTDIDTRLKDVVTVDKLPGYRAEMLAHAIKAADDYATVRESHRSEFSEPLDRTAFEKFVADQKAANIAYPTMSAAHDAFVKDKRVTAAAAAEKARTEAAIAEAKKQWESAARVPGQTQSTAVSAAQQVMAKARAGSGGGAETAAVRVARQLEELDRQRASVQ